MTYVSQEVRSYSCRELENEPGEDATWCWIKPSNEAKILVGCIYRSPTRTNTSDENDNALLRLISKASEIAENNRMILMGDFNAKEINWLEEEAVG